MQAQLEDLRGEHAAASLELQQLQQDHVDARAEMATLESAVRALEARKASAEEALEAAPKAAEASAGPQAPPDVDFDASALPAPTEGCGCDKYLSPAPPAAEEEEEPSPEVDKKDSPDADAPEEAPAAPEAAILGAPAPATELNVCLEGPGAALARREISYALAEHLATDAPLALGAVRMPAAEDLGAPSAANEGMGAAVVADLQALLASCVQSAREVPQVAALGGPEARPRRAPRVRVCASPNSKFRHT